MSTHAVVFLLCAKSANIISVRAVAGTPIVGLVTKVRCQGRVFRAKIVFLGSKMACDAAIKNVTEDGDMRKNFSVANCSVREHHEEITAMLREQRAVVDARFGRLELRISRIEEMLERKFANASG